MKKLSALFLTALTFISTEAISQKGGRYFGEPLLTDSLSTVFIPTRYSQDFLSNNKIAFWGDYYANIIAYNFETDTYKKIFEKDSFIESLRNDYHGYPTRTTEHPKNITKKWIFLLVKTTDTNNSGRIEEKDPSILFAVSTDGQILKQLTDETENIVSFDNFEKQGFLLIKIQKDTDKDKSFKADDKEFYFRKVNLEDLTLGKGIEIK